MQRLVTGKGKKKWKDPNGGKERGVFLLTNNDWCINEGWGRRQNMRLEIRTRVRSFSRLWLKVCIWGNYCKLLGRVK